MHGESQNQKVGKNSVAKQAGRDFFEINAEQVNLPQLHGQDQKDFGIIEDIFEYLISELDKDTRLVAKGGNGAGLKKIGLNFSGTDKDRMDEFMRYTTKKRDLVKKFVEVQMQIDDSKIDAIILWFQKLFREIKSTKENFVKIEDFQIIEKMYDSCLDDARRDNPEYGQNALAIVLYFFEMCEFGKSE